jgi:hypothetical protein
VELFQNGSPLDPKIYTKMFNSFEIGEKITFPMKVSDLAYKSKIGISIYDMNKPYSESLLGSTTVDIFDKKQRLRQGMYNLFIWKGQKIDMSFNSKTPGLLKVTEESSLESKLVKNINQLLKKIDLYQKRPNINHTFANRNNVTKDQLEQKEWQDDLAKDGILQQLFDYYLQCKDFCLLEVYFPQYGNTVIYGDEIDSQIKEKYLFPKPLVQKFEESQ